MTEMFNNDATRRQFILSTGALAALSVTPRSDAFPEPLAPEISLAPQETSEVSEITIDTMREAQRIAGVEFTEEELKLALRGVQGNVSGYQRRMEHVLPNGVGPAQTFDCRLPGMTFAIQKPFVRSRDSIGSVPDNDEDIAFAPLTSLSRWIQRGQLTSARLTKIYLDRLKKHGPGLECVITLTEDLAMTQANRADREIANGTYRGPLHGIPWGGKDLLDTNDILTTWGAGPYKTRVAEGDAAVVKKLEEAGAVLVAKLTLGALAMGDHWYGGRTNNPFNPEQGSSGSSAGSAAATAAGLVAFAIGTETLGSIVSPCMRCGTTGLRPTFGRVSRAGAMALCWSLDKIGSICRTSEDTILVLDAIHGADLDDPCSVDMPLNFNAKRSIKGLRMGYDPDWFEPSDNDRFRESREMEIHTLEVAKSLGVEPVKIKMPELPYGSMISILSAEAAAAFEELTLNNRDDELKRQTAQSWPTSFREARFIPAIEIVQAERIRRQAMHAMAQQFENVDFMLGPSYAGGMLLITNNTGHPSLTIRCGFRENGSPHGITLIGNLFDEGTIVNMGVAMEKKLGVWDQRPKMA
ncbi:MAG: amidase [Planctomycetota bacterium]|nr:amidase [Planctomycetota bacterium]